MRRIMLYATGTLAGVVAVMLYPTSTNQAASLDAAAVSSTQTSTTELSTTEPSTTDSGTADSGTGSSSTDSSSTSSSTTDSSTETGTGLTDGTYTATSTMRYGTVSVTVTVSGGEVTDVQASQESNDPKSEQIAAQAIPTLNSEATAAQSASISMVSHATYTSQAYLSSLQEALDQAAA